MLLRPNRLKFNKTFKKLDKKRIETKRCKLEYGILGIQALQKGKISARQIEATRRAITGSMKRRGKIWIKIFPSVPITTKALESRMGKGKGNVSHWVSFVYPGQILFEVAGGNEQLIIDALSNASTKLPIKIKIIKRPIV